MFIWSLDYLTQQLVVLLLIFYGFLGKNKRSNAISGAARNLLARSYPMRIVVYSEAALLLVYFEERIDFNATDYWYCLFVLSMCIFFKCLLRLHCWVNLLGQKMQKNLGGTPHSNLLWRDRLPRDSYLLVQKLHFHLPLVLRILPQTVLRWRSRVYRWDRPLPQSGHTYVLESCNLQCESCVTGATGAIGVTDTGTDDIDRCSGSKLVFKGTELAMVRSTAVAGDVGDFRNSENLDLLYVVVIWSSRHKTAPRRKLENGVCAVIIIIINTLNA